jgi:hypothetical protein
MKSRRRCRRGRHRHQRHEPDDLPYTYPDGKSASGNTMIQFTGGLAQRLQLPQHRAHLLQRRWHLRRQPHDAASRIRQYETEDEREGIISSFRENRIKILDHRPEHPRAYPAMLSFNLWDSNIEGSTVFRRDQQHVAVHQQPAAHVRWSDGGTSSMT